MRQITLERCPYLGIYVNSFVFETSAGSVFVDTGLASGGDQLLSRVKGSPVVLSTHGHWDHVGAHRRLQEQGARIYAHPGDDRYFQDFDWHWKVLFEQFRDDFALPPERKTTFDAQIGQPVKPDRYLKDGERFSIGDCVIQALHTPGHSDGSVCYLLPDDGVLFTGDTLMGNGFFGGVPQCVNMAAYRDSMERLKSLRVETVYCDHNEPIPGARLADKAEASIACADRIEKRVRAFVCGYRGDVSQLLKEAVRDVCAAENKNPGGGACVTVLCCLRDMAVESDLARACAERHMSM